MGLAIPGYAEFNFPSDYIIGRCVAEGALGRVLECEALSPALKRVVGDESVRLLVKLVTINSERSRLLFTQELGLTYLFRNNVNIVTMYGWSELSPTSVVMIMRRYTLGDFGRMARGTLTRQPPFAYSKSTVLSILRQATLGMRELHQRGISHCDAKSANIFVDVGRKGEVVAALGDLGIARVVDRTRTNISTTEFPIMDVRGLSISYAAPEVITRMHKGAESSTALSPATIWYAGDVYSLAVIACEAINRRIWN